MATQKVTDLTAQATVNLTDTYHVVNTTDTSQDPAGSSYKITWATLKTAILGYFSAGTGITYSGGVISADPTATQTLTNKTLTSPVITTPTVTGALTNNGSYAGSAIVPVANGGTGQATVGTAINALLPSQTSNSGKVLSTDGTNPLWSTVGNGVYNASTFTASYSAAAVDPVRVAYASYTPISFNSATGINGFAFGATTTSSNVGRYQAQSFTTNSTGASITQIVAGIKKLGTPGDNVVVTIRSDSAGSPSATTVATSSTTLSGPTVTTSFVNYTFAFSNVRLTPSTQYWIFFTRSGATSDTDNYLLSDVNAGTGSKTCAADGVTWTAGHPNLGVAVTSNEGTVGTILLATATDTPQSQVIGFCVSSIANTASGLVATNGILSGFTGLTVGSTYYLQDNGTISTTAGTVSKKVGVAVSTTQLLLQIS